jgi:hypothetical protein
MIVAAVILILVVLFMGCLVFLFAFAHRLGVSERTKPDMFMILFRFALVATAIIATLWFFPVQIRTLPAAEEA